MSVDQAFREMIRAEIARELKPLQNVVNQLQQSASDLDTLRALAQGLGPIAAMFGLAPAPVSAPTPRRGRPPKNAVRETPSRLAAGGGCGIAGCRNEGRTKGYCAAHYQKLRLLIRTHRRPAAWIDFPAPGSVEDLKLPRGRAAAKARQGG